MQLDNRTIIYMYQNKLGAKKVYKNVLTMYIWRLLSIVNWIT